MANGHYRDLPALKRDTFGLPPVWISSSVEARAVGSLDDATAGGRRSMTVCRSGVASAGGVATGEDRSEVDAGATVDVGESEVGVIACDEDDNGSRTTL